METASILPSLPAAREPGTPASAPEETLNGAEPFGAVLARQLQLDSHIAVVPSAPGSDTEAGDETAATQPASENVVRLEPAWSLAIPEAALAMHAAQTTAEPKSPLPLVIPDRTPSPVRLEADARADTRALQLQAAIDGTLTPASGALPGNIVGVSPSPGIAPQAPDMRPLPAPTRLAETTDTILAPAQGAPQAAPAAPTPASALPVPPSVGSPRFAEDFSRQIVWIAARQLQQAELRLDPPELGPVRVTLQLRDDQASAVFSALHPQTRDAIEAALPRLKEMMAEAGIQLGSATVSGEGFTGEREFARSDHSSQRLPALFPASDAPSVPIRRAQGLVDLFA